MERTLLLAATHMQALDHVFRVLNRYYNDPATTDGAAGVTDELADLKPGQLSSETREALGLGPLDPPPWLDKMRQLGYPPMYR